MNIYVSLSKKVNFKENFVVVETLYFNKKISWDFFSAGPKVIKIRSIIWILKQEV